MARAHDRFSGMTTKIAPPHYAAAMPNSASSASTATLWTTRLDRALPAPLSRQLAASLREALSEGRIEPGARLPSTRALARELGLARSTIVGVFEQLTAEGYIAGRPGSGSGARRVSWLPSQPRHV